MVVAALSLLIIGISVGWYFSCSGDSTVCQVHRSFSIGGGIFGLIGLAMGAFILVEDRINARASESPSDGQGEG